MRFLGSRQFEVVGCQAMSPAPRSGVRLDEYGARFLAALKLDEVVTTSERSHLFDASLRPSLSTERRLPAVIDRHAVALSTAPVKRCAVLVNIVFGPASDEIVEFAPIQSPE